MSISTGLNQRKILNLIDSILSLTLIPSVARLHCDIWERRPPPLSILICSGELFPTNLARKLRKALPNTTLLNIYGSSETTADCCFYPLPKNINEIDSDLVPIGNDIY